MGRNSLRQLCILVRLVARVTRYSRSTQIRCGGKYNTRFVANFLAHVIVKNYENWFTNKKVIANIKRGVVFET